MCFIFLSECYIIFEKNFFLEQERELVALRQPNCNQGTLPFHTESSKSAWYIDSTPEVMESTTKAGSKER